MSSTNQNASSKVFDGAAWLYSICGGREASANVFSSLRVQLFSWVDGKEKGVVCGGAPEEWGGEGVTRC